MAKASKVARYNLLQAFNDIYGNTYRANQSLVLWMQMTPTSPTDSSDNLSTTVSYLDPLSNLANTQVVFKSSSSQRYWEATFADADGTEARAVNTDGDFCFTNLSDLGTPTATSDRPFSVSLWAKITPTVAREVLFEKQYTNVDNSWEYRAQYNSGYIYFHIRDANASKYVGIGLSTPASAWTNEWHHFIFTYDGRGSSGGYLDVVLGMKAYVDGVAQPTTSNSQSGYVGMKPNFSGYLSIGSDADSAPEMDGSVSEFAVWSKQLSAAETNAIYNASLYGSAELLSGFLNNPPRTILQARDNATGSYPTVSRIGDPGRTGRYAANFNDTSTVVFNSDVTVSYPTDLQSADVAYINQSIATPNANATIEATGIVRKGVGDANITFTPGEDLKPFVEDGLYASTPEAFTDPFYMTGSTVVDVGLGFTAPLRSKTKIEIDLKNSEALSFGFYDHFAISPMAYYNFSLQSGNL